MSYFAAAEDHQRLEWLGGSTMTVLLDSAATDGQLMVTSTSLADGDAAPLHVHAREDEVFVVLTGSVVIWCGEDRREVGPGGVAFLPRDVPHAYRATSKDTRVMTLTTPGGLEGFFRGAGHDVSQPRPDGWTISPATMAPVAAAHGVTLLGPPPQL